MSSCDNCKVLEGRVRDCRAELASCKKAREAIAMDLHDEEGRSSNLRAELATAKEALRLASEWAMESVGSCPLDQCDWTPPEGCKDRCGDDKVVIGCWVDYFLDAALRDGGEG